ncbi:hypothetical protein ABZ897_55235 [Nonomuraea sp. NPDC046802]|uniref:hypothetical protein n=1 Tax=Nonomuraea sp. NPDC046802 TaxID=3154919 RepID=UPI0033D5F6FB
MRKNGKQAGTSPPWTLVGAHGGAGTSTLVTLLNHQASAPRAVEYTGGTLPVDHRVAVVTSSTATGTQRTAQMLAGWPRELPRPVLLVRAADPFGLPPMSRYQLKAISTEVDAVIRVPYLFVLRQLDVSAALTSSSRAARLAQLLRRRMRALPADAGRRP